MGSNKEGESLPVSEDAAGGADAPAHEEEECKDAERDNTQNPTTVTDQPTDDDRLQDGGEVYFRIKHTTRIRRLMTAYCDRMGHDRDSVRFLFDGDRINEDCTAKELGLETGDIIDAMAPQSGGTVFNYVPLFVKN